MTDVVTGWIQLEVLRNNARVHMLAGLDRAAAAIPYEFAGLDADNGSEFINHEVMHWAADRLIFFTRSRPYYKNDQAMVESKNNHAVRRYGFHYRYDTDDERAILAALWEVVCLKLNFFTATKKPNGWSQDANGKRKRLYQSIIPAQLTCQILMYQDRLISESKQQARTARQQTGIEIKAS